MSAKKKPTSEVQEKVQEEVSTSEVELVTLTLDEYLTANPVHPGLLASFKWEASQDRALLDEKSEDAWRQAFEAQSKKTYT